MTEPFLPRSVRAGRTEAEAARAGADRAYLVALLVDSKRRSHAELAEQMQISTARVKQLVAQGRRVRQYRLRARELHRDFRADTFSGPGIGEVLPLSWGARLDDYRSATSREP